MNDIYRFDLKCVICGHKWSQTFTGRGDAEPHCPKCLGPVTVENATAEKPKRMYK
jgi:hypothetical protein